MDYLIRGLVRSYVRLNIQNASEIQSVNSTRAKIEKTLHEQIASCNIQIQQHRSQLDRRLAQYHDKLTEIDNQLTMYNDSPNLIQTIDRDDHPLRLQYKRRAVTSSIQSENTWLNTEIKIIDSEIEYFKGEKDSIKFLKESSHDHHWILKNENLLTGFHPLTNQIEKILNNSLLSDADISR